MIIISGQSLPALSNPGAAGDLKNGKQLIDANGNVLTGTMSNITLPSPGITVSTGGLITASYSQDAGYSAGGSKSATKQLTTQAGTTITPGTSQKTAVASGRYTTGNVYVAGDSDLKASNIKSGVNIFGVDGSYSADIKGYCFRATPNDIGYSRTSGYFYYYEVGYLSNAPNPPSGKSWQVAVMCLVLSVYGSNQSFITYLGVENSGSLYQDYNSLSCTGPTNVSRSSLEFGVMDSIVDDWGGSLEIEDGFIFLIAS